MSAQDQTTQNQTISPTVDDSNATHDLLETATRQGLQHFPMAVGAADLAGVLGGPDLLTVFAPTDDAHGNLPPDSLKQLMLPEAQQSLIGVLRNHIISGAFREEDLRLAGQVKTLDGATLPVEVKDGFVHIAGARIEKGNIACTNGVLHLVDTVLIPQ